MPKPYPPTPELDKMNAAKAESQPIGQFLDWLSDTKRVELCQPHEHTDQCYAPDDEEKEKPTCHVRAGELLPFHFNSERLLAEYFKIDLNKVEQERRAILQSLRQ